MRKILITGGTTFVSKYAAEYFLKAGLKEVAVWYLENEAEVNKKPYFDYLDANLAWSLYEKF